VRAGASKRGARTRPLAGGHRMQPLTQTRARTLTRTALQVAWNKAELSGTHIDGEARERLFSGAELPMQSAPTPAQPGRL
jgi:hypothetical protein